jgi:hypothetical protein
MANRKVIGGMALVFGLAALALPASLVLSGCGSKCPERIAAEIEKLQVELEKTQSAGDAEIAETNGGTAQGGIDGFIQRYSIAVGIITGLVAGLFCLMLFGFIALASSYNLIFIPVVLEIAGIAVIIVAGFVQQKLPLGFSISCLASNVVPILILVSFANGEKPEEKKSDCFITSAVCRSFAKPDDCYELSLFRRFRDGWLTGQPEGPALIERYYRTAPAIVAAIDRSPDRDAVYRRIWDAYLAPCLCAIENGRLEDCKQQYIGMVETLGEEYL